METFVHSEQESDSGGADGCSPEQVELRRRWTSYRSWAATDHASVQQIQKQISSASSYSFQPAEQQGREQSETETFSFPPAGGDVEPYAALLVHLHLTERSVAAASASVVKLGSLLASVAFLQASPSGSC